MKRGRPQFGSYKKGKKRILPLFAIWKCSDLLIWLDSKSYFPPKEIYLSLWMLYGIANF
jgi:hypothetical protein